MREYILPIFAGLVVAFIAVCICAVLKMSFELCCMFFGGMWVLVFKTIHENHDTKEEKANQRGEIKQ